MLEGEGSDLQGGRWAMRVDRRQGDGQRFWAGARGTEEGLDPGALRSQRTAGNGTKGAQGQVRAGICFTSRFPPDGAVHIVLLPVVP